MCRYETNLPPHLPVPGKGLEEKGLLVGSSQRDTGEIHFQVKGIRSGPEEKAGTSLKVRCRWKRPSAHSKGGRDAERQALLLLALPTATSYSSYKKKRKLLLPPVTASEPPSTFLPVPLLSISHHGSALLARKALLARCSCSNLGQPL